MQVKLRSLDELIQLNIINAESLATSREEQQKNGGEHNSINSDMRPFFNGETILELLEDFKIKNNDENYYFQTRARFPDGNNWSLLNEWVIPEELWEEDE